MASSTKINYLVLSYPDFTLGSIIDPEEFDQNNLDLQDKLNETIEVVNNNIDETIRVEGRVDTNVTAISNAQVTADNATILANNAQDTADANAINIPVYADNILNTHKASGDHDERYYTKALADAEFVSHSEVDIDSNIRLYVEVFTIVNPDNGDGTFTYQNEDGFLVYGSLYDDDKYQMFVLTKGDYTMNDNRIEAIVNDTLHRSSVSGGLVELNSTTVAVMKEGAGAEVAVKYFSIEGSIGSGIIVGDVQPVKTYLGKLWIDTN